MIQPSRILNEKNGFLGLTYFDCALLVMLTLQFHGYLATYDKEWVALAIGPILALGLVQVRLKYRRGIILSFIYFALRKRKIRQPTFTLQDSSLAQFRRSVFKSLSRVLVIDGGASAQTKGRGKCFLD